MVVSTDFAIDPTSGLAGPMVDPTVDLIGPMDGHTGPRLVLLVLWLVLRSSGWSLCLMVGHIDPLVGTTIVAEPIIGPTLEL